MALGPSDAPRRFFTCEGGLPRRLPARTAVLVHLEGCAVWAVGESGGIVAELVVTAELKRVAGTVFFHQTASAASRLGLNLDGGWRCHSPVIGLHGLLIRCSSTRTIPSSLHIRINGGAVATEVGLVERLAHADGALMACTGRVVYGNMDERLRLHAISHAAWSAVGCKSLWTFAQSKESCAALRKLGSSISCEVRGTIDASGDRRSQHLYEQPTRHLLCLVYARATQAAFLALTDADELPPPLLPRLLEQAANNRRLAGLRFFFDPDGSCPAYYCPINEADWKSKCPTKPGQPKRNHWKPIVVPNRTQDVDVHQFTPIPPHVRKQVWRLCFQHRHSTSLEAARALERESQNALQDLRKRTDLGSFIV